MIRAKVLDYCKYIPLAKDSSGNVTENRAESINRVEKIKKIAA